MSKCRVRRRAGVVARTAALLLAVMAPVAARASMTLLVEQPYGKLGLFDPGGHSAVYLDRVCAASPTKLRPCRSGELGVVLSRYDGIGGYDWLAMPLVPYLYAVDSTAEIPRTMTREREAQLRDAYRRQYLEALAPDAPNGATPAGNWYELIGSSYDRTIYGFRVRTTADQDAMLIAEFNDSRNKERYNGFYQNCADFVRVTIDRVYPHAIRRNYIADLGVTSPKAAARGLAHYAKKHPEAGLSVFVIPQVPGDLPRSHSNTGVIEGVVRRYSVPLVLISPEAEGVALVAYISRGRFEMPKDAPALDLEALQAQLAISQPFPMALPTMPEPLAPQVVESDVAPVGTAGASEPVSMLQ